MNKASPASVLTPAGSRAVDGAPRSDPQTPPPDAPQTLLLWSTGGGAYAPDLLMSSATPDWIQTLIRISASPQFHSETFVFHSNQCRRITTANIKTPVLRGGAKSITATVALLMCVFLACSCHFPATFLPCSGCVPCMFLACSWYVPGMFLACSWFHAADCAPAT